MNTERTNKPTMRSSCLLALALLTVLVTLTSCGNDGDLQTYDVEYLGQEYLEKQMTDSFLLSDGGSENQTDSMSSAQSSQSSQSSSPPVLSLKQPKQFKGYGIGEPVDTADDPLSTFALDVDTASYVIARNYLMGLTLPPSDAVRVEEFVNYMPGGYVPVPDLFSLNIDAAPSLYDDENVMMRIGVQAPLESDDIVTADSIILVVDRSGSMGDHSGLGAESTARFLLVRDAISLLLTQLDGERVGMVVYETFAEVVLEPRAVNAANVDDVLTVIHKAIRPGGSTNAEAGLVYGFNMAAGEVNAGRNTLVLMFSDGVANVGNRNTDSILETIGERADISLSTVGVGLGEYNDELMEQLANRADGTYHYMDTAAEAVRLFVDSPAYRGRAAKDAKIQVEFNPAVVVSYRLVGYENRALEDEAFTDDTRDAGEVAPGQTATALYELTLHDDPPADAVVATASLRYELPTSGEVSELETSFRVSEIVEFPQIGGHYQITAVAGAFAELLRGSPYTNEVTFGHLRDIIAGIEDRFDPASRETAALNELAELINLANDSL